MACEGITRRNSILLALNSVTHNKRSSETGRKIFCRPCQFHKFFFFFFLFSADFSFVLLLLPGETETPVSIYLYLTYLSILILEFHYDAGYQIRLINLQKKQPSSELSEDQSKTPCTSISTY